MRLIDADALKKRLAKCVREGVNLNFGIARIIENAPTIDAVPVIRCKDCEYKKEYRGGDICYRLKGTAWIVDDDFCSYAERRSDED